MIERDRGHSAGWDTPEHPPAYLTFTLHGRLTSANAIKLPQVRGKRAVMIKTREAKEDAERILELATAAVKQSGWVMPGSAAMEIVMWNSRLDVGNVEKLLADSCSGLVFSDDRILTELHVLKRRDRGGERYVVTVRAIGEPAARIPDNTAPSIPLRHTPVAKQNVRSLDELKSGDLLNFAERDALLKSGVVPAPSNRAQPDNESRSRAIMRRR